MFIDRVRTKLMAGAGGNGCTSFRREKYVAKGGPNGGDGGHGGEMYFVASSRLSTLQDIKFHSVWIGKKGVHGKGSDMHGKNGEDSLILVPVGTVVHDWDTGEILADLAEDGQRFSAARGGKGGKGNARFATSTNRVPRFHEVGEPGQIVEYRLDLKLLADIGIVGLPNAGKSTFLARVTAATPKIGDYPFTTISPNLGVVELSDYRTLNVADIPGIIEGAAEGKGLGHDFLRHIERTKVLLFFIDPGEEDPVETLRILENELAKHSEVFETRPRVVAFTKADVTEYRDLFEAHTDKIPNLRFISSATGEGVDALLEELWQALDRYNKEQEGLVIEGDSIVEYVYDAPFKIECVDDGFIVEGKNVVRAVRMTDFTNEEAILHLDKKFSKMGLYKALKRLGAEEGQTIYVGDVEMEYHK
ncbi:MAG: GTPase ObgE [Candidatus Hydrogenedentota bacterium]|nr:MAG: GTPase ObgE [Candidatus Hydrogenedentota bacterium]